MAKDRLLLYGATGFTGTLLIDRLKDLRRTLILGGRDSLRLDELAQRHGLAYRAFGLDKRSRDAMDAALDDVKLVINAAGPFADTAVPLALGCVRTWTHYVDVCGELKVFRALYDLNEEAAKRKVAIMPGAAMSIVASEALVQQAARDLALLPSDGRSDPSGMRHVHSIRLGFSRLEHASRGSVRTALESIRERVIVRRNHTLQTVRIGELERIFNFGGGDRRLCTAMSLAEAYAIGRKVTNESPGVPNIEAYVEVTPLERALYDLGGVMATPLKLAPLKGLARRWTGLWPEGPDERERRESPQVVVAEVEDRYRRQIRLRFESPNCYDFTANAAAGIARGIMGNAVPLKPGFQTPGEVFRLDVKNMPRVFQGTVFVDGKNDDVTEGPPSRAAAATS